MFNEIKNYALQQYAGDEVLAQNFVDSFTKELLEKAADYDDKGGNFGESVIKGLGSAVGKGVGGFAVGMGMHGLSSILSSVKNDRLHNDFLTALAKAIASNPVLRQANKDKVKNYADTIFRFAPHVATDSNLLSSVLANAVHGEGIDPMTIRSLTDLESRFVESANSPAFSPKAYV